MSAISYLGGIQKRGAERLAEPAGFGPGPGDDVWQWPGEDAELVLRTRGRHFQTFTFDHLAVLLRGYAVPSSAGRVAEPARVAEMVQRHYRQHGTLPTRDLEG